MIKFLAGGAHSMKAGPSKVLRFEEAKQHSGRGGGRGGNEKPDAHLGLHDHSEPSCLLFQHGLKRHAKHIAYTLHPHPRIALN